MQSAMTARANENLAVTPLIEQWAFNPLVTGSSPVRRTKPESPRHLANVARACVRGYRPDAGGMGHVRFDKALNGGQLAEVARSRPCCPEKVY